MQAKSAAADSDEDSDDGYQDAVAKNEKAFLDLVKKQKLPKGLNLLVIKAEHHAVWVTDMQEDEENFEKFTRQLNDALSRFLEEKTVGSIEVVVDMNEPLSSRWVLTRTSGAKPVKTTFVARTPLRHFTRMDVTDEISAMGSNTHRCIFSQGQNKFLTFAQIKYLLSADEMKKEQRKRMKEMRDNAALTPQQRKYKAPFHSRAEPSKKAFFAGDFQCVENLDSIQVSNPNRAPETAVYLTIPKDRVNVIGLHSWGEQHIILVTITQHQSQLHIINIDTRIVEMQTIPFRCEHSQVAQMDGMDEPQIFLQHSSTLMTYKQSPAGFVHANIFKMEVPKPHASNVKCFDVGTRHLCVGMEEFVIIYNLAQYWNDMEAWKASKKQSPKEKLRIENEAIGAYFFCERPVEVLLVDPSAPTNILVATEHGVVMLTPR